MDRWITIAGNEAAARIAYKVSEVIAIYPITPSSDMGELCDQWSAEGLQNIWGTIPTVREMQSEGGAAGAVHGAIQAGSLCTTFTASQGLLLMIPNMFKIAGELSPAVFHISARTVATHALSIFGDHSDVMACRPTGWAMLFGGSPQEVQDLALIAHSATLKAQVPFLNIFDGFRTSHEIQKIVPLDDAEIKSMIDEKLVAQHRSRSMNPDHPTIRGTAQNPDVFFQTREAVNPFYDATAGIVADTMDQFHKLTGRQYNLFDYIGSPQAERVIVMMGSGSECAEEAVRALNAAGEKVGLVKVRLFRPFDGEKFMQALPPTVQSIAVLDRTKEPGAVGEPLFQEVVTVLAVHGHPAAPKTIGGRYGLSSKEFTPTMVKAVFDELNKPEPKRHFTVGIHDDITHLSLDLPEIFDTEDPLGYRAVFWGLGADGTVGANKNTIKIIGEETPNYAQGYFVYDSKKSGSVTVSHLRFGPNPIRSTYLIRQANFVGIHQFGLIFRYPVLDRAAPGATVLLNSPFGPEETWERLPRTFQQEALAKEIKLYVLDAYQVAQETGMGVRINSIMQTAFFALCGILPPEEAVDKIRHAIEKTYGKRGPQVVAQNFAAVDQALAHMHEAKLGKASSDIDAVEPVSASAPAFVRDVLGEIIALRGDDLPVSAFRDVGTYPTGTTQYEKRSISLDIPVWDPAICSQCGKCVLLCPHGAMRAKVIRVEDLKNAPHSFHYADAAKFRGGEGLAYVIEASAEDCTGCGLCLEVCPERGTTPEHAGASLEHVDVIPESNKENWEYFVNLTDEPALPETPIFDNAKALQLIRPLFEFSGACAGCGETPYLKLLSQLVGDRLLIANATGCSSIFGGNLPTTPWSKDSHGRGPSWNNSLFEDNAEFGLGMRLSIDSQRDRAFSIIKKERSAIGDDLVDQLLAPEKYGDPDALKARREVVDQLRAKLQGQSSEELAALASLADSLVDRSVWIVGGDGWAYDIGFGGLDHVLASQNRVRILVLDTEVYSNTGGQASKSTPRAAVAKFATAGKPTGKKDLGRIAMTYGHVYVAEVAIGADDNQTIRAFREAEAHNGPAIIVAYCHCIAHDYDMKEGYAQQKRAVESGYWPLYRFNPARAERGRNPLMLDSADPTIPLRDYVEKEGRYRVLMRRDPELADVLLSEAQKDVDRKWLALSRLAATKEP
ncbi:MAG: pyruvate:ferredoxin (flavodoxin) oxidoreductase [Armatimonadetes bacterium]|nr:pyruvate:ferredoxin (flavodoxin) oxidoreductase [Armatimonadota bacterium]